MINKQLFISIFLVFVFSIELIQCQRSKNQNLFIPELLVQNKYYQKQIDNIFFKSHCFKVNQHERYVVYVSNSNIRKDMLIVSFHTYLGFNKGSLTSILGGFFKRYNGRDYIFLINNNSDFLKKVYRFTGNTLNISKYTGFIEEDDVNLYLKEIKGNLLLVYTDCP